MESTTELLAFLDSSHIVTSTLGHVGFIAWVNVTYGLPSGVCLHLYNVYFRADTHT